jgi:hypothetical protein
VVFVVALNINFLQKCLDNKKIVYCLIDAKNYALSKNVFASCFFCGKSGPETITGLKFKGGLPKLKTDTYLTIKGTFKVNETDVDNWIYNIENAEIVSKN